MARDPCDAFDIKNTLGGNLFPLGYSLGGNSTQGFREGGGTTGFLFGNFADVFHAQLKAYLSRRCKHFFR